MTYGYEMLNYDDRDDLVSVGNQYRSIYTYAGYNDLESQYGKQPSFKDKKHAMHFTSGLKNTIMVDNDEGSCYRSIVETFAIIVSYLIMFVTLPFSLALCLRFVASYESMIIFRLGRAQKPRGPGIVGAVIILPCIDTFKKVDLRTKAFNVPPIQAVTQDTAVVELGASIMYKIKDWNLATRTLAHTLLHNNVNKKRQNDLVHDKKTIEDAVKGELNLACNAWGMEITEVELSEVKVYKEAENQAVKAFKSIAKSNVMQGFFKQIQDVMAEQGIENPGFEEALALMNAPDSAPAPESPQLSWSDNSVSWDQVKLEDKPMESELPTNSLNEEADPKVDLDGILSTINLAVDEQLVEEINCIYQIECIGLDKFVMDIKNGKGQTYRGVIHDADVNITLSIKDLAALLIGSLAPLDGYMSGKIKVKGDIRAAVKLQSLANKIAQIYANMNL